MSTHGTGILAGSGAEGMTPTGGGTALGHHQDPFRKDLVLVEVQHNISILESQQDLSFCL